MSAKDFQYFDTDDIMKPRWRQLRKISRMTRYEVTGHAMASANGKLYVAGGRYQRSIIEADDLIVLSF